MALLRFLLLLLLGVSVNSDVSLQKRIIGGLNCDNTERLYHVRLERTDGTAKRWCGGSLIHPEWILTAAHCWTSEPGWTNKAVLKVHPRTAGQQESQASQDNPVIYSRRFQQHDIMLLRLQTPVADVQPAQLPDCNNTLKIGDEVQLAGEGFTAIGPNNQRIIFTDLPAHLQRLQCVDMNVVQVSQLHETRGKLFHAKAQNKDICYGDSGGAAMHNGKIYGVISFVGSSMAFRKAALIMDVCEYMWWIKAATGLN